MDNNNQPQSPSSEDLIGKVNQLETDFVNHKHRDYDKTPKLDVVYSLAKTGSAKITGDVTLTAGANTTITQSGNDITIAETTAGISTAQDYQLFTANGTWTKPALAPTNALVLVQLWGGGASAGGTTGAANIESGAAGGGEYIEAYFRASDLNSTVAVVVAVAVTGGVGAANGTDGNTSNFGGIITARGGLHGVSGNTTGVGGDGNGYFPGLHPGGDSLDGLSGGAGSNASTGAGGKSVKGGGGGATNGQAGGTSAIGGKGGDAPSGNGDGQAGTAPAGGGSGCRQNGVPTARTGGGGARGEVRVFTFY